MASRFPGIVGPSYQMRSIPVDCQRSINLMPERVESQFAKSRYILRTTPGFTSKKFQFKGLEEIYDELPTEFPGKIRGLYYTSKGFFGKANGALIAVAAESVFEVSPANILGICEIRKIGVVSNLSGDVSMIDDGFGLIISDNVTLYRCELETSEFGSLGTESPLQASSVTFLGGYTICAGRRDGVPSNTFFYSNQYDNSVWGELSYYTAEGFADPVTKVVQVAGNLWVFGSRSYEIWGLGGSSVSPFVRIAGSMGNIGCASPASVAVIADKVFFLGNGEQGNRMAWMSDGYNVVPISNDALHEEWGSYQNFDDTAGFAYSQEGHVFWVVTWLAENKTWVYDLQTNSWHERASRDPQTDVLNRWTIVKGIYSYDSIYIGDLEGTKLYTLETETYTEDGNQIVRIRRAPHISHEEKIVFHRALIIDVETGVGLAVGQGRDPQIMLRFSNDAGRTPNGQEIWRPIGEQGKYRTRCKWPMLGSARDRVYELYFSDPVPFTILDAWLDLAVSSSGR